MNVREELTLLAVAASILLTGGALGAAIVALHHIDGPPLINDGALDMAEDRPIAP